MSKEGYVDGQAFEPGIGVCISGSAAIGKWTADSAKAGYHALTSSIEGREYTVTIEVFHCPYTYRLFTEEETPLAPGWYFWPCQPGCLPDGEAEGPHQSSQEAYARAEELYKEV